MIYHRKLYLDSIKKAIKKEKLVLLYGQRQVGKTTLMQILINDKRLNQEKKYFSFEDTQTRNFNSKEDFINFLKLTLDIDFQKEGILFLDEVQYVTNIVGILKSLYDDIQIKTKIIATGSGMRNIPTIAGSSLVGRGEEIYIYPFSFEEFLGYKGKGTNALNPNNYSNSTSTILIKHYQEYLIRGGYPEVIKANTEEKKQQELQKIIKRFFEKDVLFRFKQNEISKFEKVFYYLFQNIGNLLKIEHISNITGVGVKTVKKHINFLKRSLVIFDIKPYFKNKSKEIFSQPNMYLSDLGILSYLGKNYGDKLQNGKTIENFVFLELLKNYQNHEIKFYKKKNGTEIDFILEKRNGNIIPIEVKSGDSTAIPKIFFNFNKDYKKEILFFCKTTKTLYDTNTIDDKELYLCPNFLIGSSFKDKLETTA